jgi:pyrimidine deaminase RibD-like protein
MSHADLMNLAITLAKQCQPKDRSTTPRVGAVVALDGRPIAQASRGQDDHAEKIALSKVPEGQSLLRATVYTTLEPCTHHVRRRTLDSCSDRLVAAHVEKVVIGMLDPNQEVCGRGVLRLQRAGVEVELFPRELASRIASLNEEFIRAQQSLGIRIVEPKDGAKLQKRKGSNLIVRVKGTLVNVPSAGDEVYAILRKDDHWWPQAKVSPSPGTNEWSARVSIGGTGSYVIYIVKANPLGKSLLHYYYRVGNLHHQWRARLRNELKNSTFNLPGPDYPSIVQLSLPKGLDAEAWVQVEVVGSAS